MPLNQNHHQKTHKSPQECPTLLFLPCVVTAGAACGEYRPQANKVVPTELSCWGCQVILLHVIEDRRSTSKHNTVDGL